jgi:hypothetical protein
MLSVLVGTAFLSRQIWGLISDRIGDLATVPIGSSLAGRIDDVLPVHPERSGLAYPVNAEYTSMLTRHHAVAREPDSGAGWLAVLSAFIAGFVVFGVMYSFGVFFTPMAAEFHASRTATSVFFAITGMLFYFFGSR